MVRKISKINKKKQTSKIRKNVKINKKKKKKSSASGFKQTVKMVEKLLRHANPNTLYDAISLAIKYVKDKGIKSPPRIIEIPKVGGVLPLIPIFAGLSALGSMSGGIAAIAKAVNDTRAAKQQLEETQRHNRKLESVAIGRGVFLRQYKNGLGLFL